MTATPELEPATVLRRCRDLGLEEGSDELLLHDRRHERVVALNPSAALIWELCNGRRDLARIEEYLRQQFPDACDHLADDLQLAIRRLVYGGVLEVALESAASPRSDR